MLTANVSGLRDVATDPDLGGPSPLTVWDTEAGDTRGQLT